MITKAVFPSPVKPGRRNPIMISFSGIDGAGKSTQIDALLRYLIDCGHRVTLYEFWNDIVAFSKQRESLSVRVFKGETGVGSPLRPVARRDKNVTSWYVVVLRLFLYCLDALQLLALVPSRTTADSDIVIFDRYIYDELANLPLRSWPVRVYVRLLLLIVPRPTLAVLLDAEPEAAVSRKPEYPIEFVRCNREAYLSMAKMAGMSVFPPASVPETTLCVIETLLNLRAEAQQATLEATNPLSETSQMPSS